MVKLTLVPPAVAPQEAIDAVNRSVADGKQAIAEIKARKAATKVRYMRRPPAPKRKLDAVPAANDASIDPPRED